MHQIINNELKRNLKPFYNIQEYFKEYPILLEESNSSALLNHDESMTFSLSTNF